MRVDKIKQYLSSNDPAKPMTKTTQILLIYDNLHAIDCIVNRIHEISLHQFTSYGNN